VTVNGCLLCRVEDADAFFGRQRVWEDEYWRLSVVLHGAVVGFAHLEPQRHIPFITDLDGVEATMLGPVLARATAALRAATAADKVYVYVFGDRVPHLHFNLAPYTPDSPLVSGRGLVREGAPEIDPVAHQRVAAAVADALVS
jgi:diadenosine tetraphosphate (Ap4A) HIT family hydrolase